MTQLAVSTPRSEECLPQVNRITLDHPWQWLAAGWHDLIRAAHFSLAYGVIFSVVSLLITMGLLYQELFFVVPPLTAGFFLVAPLLGMGLYSISASLAQGQEIRFSHVWRVWKCNEVHLATMSVILLLLLIMWMLAANLVFALLFDHPVPSWERFIPVVFLSGESPLFLFAGLTVGGLIAAFTFTISVVSVPLLMDRPIDLFSAIQTSIQAVRSNWQPMILWACLIVMFVGIGIITFYVGLVVTMPLIGHASWHAYQDLIQPN